MHRQQQLFCVIAILFSILGCFLILVVNIKTAELNDNRLLVLNQISQLEEENRQPGVYCRSYGTKVNDFWKALHKIRDLNEKNPGAIKIFKCIFWHLSKEVEQNWFTKDCVKNKKFLDHYLNRDGKDKDGVEVIFEYMPTTRSSTIDNGEEVE